MQYRLDEVAAASRWERDGCPTFHRNFHFTETLFRLYRGLVLEFRLTLLEKFRRTAFLEMKHGRRQCNYRVAELIFLRGGNDNNT